MLYTYYIYYNISLTFYYKILERDIKEISPTLSHDFTKAPVDKLMKKNSKKKRLYKFIIYPIK